MSTVHALVTLAFAGDIDNCTVLDYFGTVAFRTMIFFYYYNHIYINIYYKELFVNARFYHGAYWHGVYSAC